MNFTTNLPELTINENLFALVCPDIIYSSQNTITQISFFNTLNICENLEANTVIFTFKYSEEDKILTIPTKQDQIYREDRFLSCIVQTNLGQNLASITERFARNLMFKEQKSTKVFQRKALLYKNEKRG